MSHHLLAYTASVPNGVNNSDVPGVQDNWASLQNNHFLTPKDSRLVAAAGVGATIQRMRVVSPTLRAIILPHVQPLNVGAAIVSVSPVSRYWPGGFKVSSVDELAVEITQGAGVAEREFGFLWLSDGNMNVPQGDIYTVRATAAVVTVANVWVSGALTFEQGLPKGLYSLVGAMVFGTNLLAARFVFPDGGRRPGCIGAATNAIIPDQIFRMGRLGEWGQFVHTAAPALECISAGVTTTQEVFMDLIKIG